MNQQEQMTKDIEAAMDNAKARLMELVEKPRRNALMALPDSKTDSERTEWIRTHDTNTGMTLPNCGYASDCAELANVETFTPQTQVDTEYTKFLEARNERFKRAIAEARYWLDCNAPGRAYEVLRQVQTS